MENNNSNKIRRFNSIMDAFDKSYAKFKKNNPGIHGEDLVSGFNKIVNDLYDRSISVKNFKERYPTKDDLRSEISAFLHKRKGHKVTSLRNFDEPEFSKEELLNIYFEQAVYRDLGIISFNYNQELVLLAREEL